MTSLPLRSEKTLGCSKIAVRPAIARPSGTLRALVCAAIVLAGAGCPPDDAPVDVQLLRTSEGKLVPAFGAPSAAAGVALRRQTDYLELSLETVSLNGLTAAKRGDVLFLGAELGGVTADAKLVKSVVALRTGVQAPYRHRLVVPASPYSGRALEVSFLFRLVPAKEAGPLEEMLSSSGSLGVLRLDPNDADALARSGTHYDAIIGGVSKKHGLVRYSFALHPLDALATLPKGEGQRVLAAGRYVLLLMPRKDAKKPLDPEKLGDVLTLAGTQLVWSASKKPYDASPYLVLNVARSTRYAQGTRTEKLAEAVEEHVTGGDMASAAARLAELRRVFALESLRYSTMERQLWELRVLLAESRVRAAESAAAGDTLAELAQLRRQLELHRQLRADFEPILSAPEQQRFDRGVRAAAAAAAERRRGSKRPSVAWLREVLPRYRALVGAGARIPPSPPQLTSTSPASPSRDWHQPNVLGRAEPRTLVSIFAKDDCRGPVLGTATTKDDGTFEVAKAAAAANTTTRLYASAADRAGSDASACSEELVFAHDDLAPDPPRLVLPSSPAREGSPPLAVSAEGGARVELFTTAACTGEHFASRTLDESGKLSVAVTARDNAETLVSARAIDAAGNVSPCSSAARYVHDSLAPAAPVLVATDPPSPSQVLRPAFVGSAEAASQIELFAGASCGDDPVARGAADALGRFRIPVAVTADASHVFSAIAVDAAGNRSPCGGDATYVADRTPPAEPSVAGRIEDDPEFEDERRAVVDGTTEDGAVVRVYRATSCMGAGIEAKADAAGAFSVLVPLTHKRKKQSISISVSDRAGNRSRCLSQVVKYEAPMKLDPVVPKTEPNTAVATPTPPARADPTKVEPVKVGPKTEATTSERPVETAKTEPKTEPKSEPEKTLPPKVDPAPTTLEKKPTPKLVGGKEP